MTPRQRIVRFAALWGLLNSCAVLAAFLNGRADVTPAPPPDPGLQVPLVDELETEPGAA